MSPSIRRIWLALLTIVVAIIVLRSLLEKDEHSAAEADHENSVAIHTTEIPTHRAPHSPHAPRPDMAARQVSSRTSGVIDLPTAPPLLTPPVSGIVIDQFRNWQSIPTGYVADGVVLKDGVITLPDATDTSSPRDGILISPPLPLHHPAMAAPVEQSAALPEGAGIQIQISLSEDGEAWSPWLIVQRHAPPDGKRITPEMQPMLANADLSLLDSQSSSSKAAQNLAGARIRYRLNLSATDAAPEVSDLRIWKRQTH